jgi:hypothetical protein
MLRDLARHPIACLARLAAGIETNTIEAQVDSSDHYALQRRVRLDELAATGKCLARSGKHDNLRYWPAERGSRVLIEHRRRQRARPVPVRA